MLTREDIAVIERNPLGFTATVGVDGTPNLSPKGTFVVLDDSRIAFGEVRSPGTVRNLRADPRIEVNFVDVFARRGVRLTGTARLVARADAAFDDLHIWFAAWPGLQPRMRHIVVIDLHAVRPLSSPAYDDGAVEDDLRAHWQARLVK